MRCKKILAGVVALTVMVTFSKVTLVKAKYENEISNSIMSENDNTMKFTEVSPKKMEPDIVPEEDANVMERQYGGKEYSVSKESYVYMNETYNTQNTDPNSAYIVTNDTIMQGAVETLAEMRWYAFVLDEKSKVTIPLQMVESLDADLYMFALDQGTSQLNLIGGSANTGLGVYERYTDVLDSGIYFFAVSGYEGIGEFAFAYYQSTIDANNEMNDTSQTATTVDFNRDIVGVIDSPYDIDYYKFIVTKTTLMQYSITSQDGYSLLYAGGGEMSSIENWFRLEPGTYYFAVIDKNGNYSANSTYTVNFRKIGQLANDKRANVVGVSVAGGIVYQTNYSGSIGYVNGNAIDISYSYRKNLSNSDGSQSYDISIEHKDGILACRPGTTLEPSAIHYLSSTRPAMYVSSRPALLVTYKSKEDFYKIHCRGTGAYSMNTLWLDTDTVSVIIDPNTGKLIDIAEFNYFYHFAPVGSNSITFTQAYSMKYYDNIL